jgi:hypothetical protein
MNGGTRSARIGSKWSMSVRSHALVWGWLVALALVASCSGKSLRAPPARPPPPPGSLPPLPRSSIAAVLEHRDELRLTPDQIDRLEALDDKLAERNAALREAADGTSAAGADAGPAKAATPPASRGPTMTGGRHGGGMGMGGMGMGRGSPRGGAAHHGSSDEPRAHESVEQRMDDNDTRAYLDAEETVLTPGQRERARDIAEDFREKLYDRRELLGQGHEAPR